MDKIKFGVLGCANIAQRTMIGAIQHNRDCQVISIASRNLSKAKEVSEKFQIKFSENYDDLISNTEVDAIYIPLPISMHKKWCVKAAEAKKHIICEKSLSDNFQEVEEIVNVCKRNNVLLFENFMCDYHPQHQIVLDLIQKGEIGEIRNIDAKFGFPPLPEGNIRYSKELGGGALNDAGAYTLFMAQKLTGTTPTNIFCKLYNLESSVDIMGSALVEFPNRIVANLQFGFFHDYRNEYTVWGSKGTIKVNRAYSIPADFIPQITLSKNGKEEKIACEPADHFSLLLEDFVAKIRNHNFAYDHLIRHGKAMEIMRESSRNNTTQIYEKT